MTGPAEWDLTQGAVWIATHDQAMADAAGERRNRQGRGIKGRPLGDWFAHEKGFPAAFEKLCSAIREGRIELWGRSRLGAPLEVIPAIEFRGLELADSWRGLVAFQRGDAADELAWRRGLRARGGKLPGSLPDDPADGSPQLLDPIVQPHAWRLRVDRAAVMEAFPAPAPAAKRNVETRAVRELVDLLRTHGDGFSKDEIFDLGEAAKTLGKQARERVWPKARIAAGLDARAPAGRKRKSPRLSG